MSRFFSVIIGCFGNTGTALSNSSIDALLGSIVAQLTRFSMKNSKRRVKLQNIVTELFDIIQGLWLGKEIGPFLFNIALNKIME